MNKYIAFAALALTCLAVASAGPLEIGATDDVQSELSLNPTDSEEIGRLEGKAVMFDDFCKRTRDYVIGDIRNNANGLVGNVFMTIFNGAENIGQEALSVQREAFGRIGNQIRHPEAQIAEADENNAVDQIIAEGQKNIQQSPNQPKSLFMGVVSTLAATKNAITANVLSKLNAIKSGFGLSNAANALVHACTTVAHYDEMLTEDFERTRQQLVQELPEIAKVQLSDIDCLTVRRVIRFDGVCKFAMAAKNPLIKAINYRPIPSNQ